MNIYGIASKNLLHSEGNNTNGFSKKIRFSAILTGMEREYKIGRRLPKAIYLLSYVLIISDAFVPPKPKEFVMAILTFFLRATFGT